MKKKINKRIKKALVILMTGIIMASLVGCGGESTPSPNPASEERINGEAFALDTIINLSIWGGSQEVIDGAIALVGEYENLFSKSIEGSDVYRMNNAKGEATTVSEETLELLEIGKYFSEKTEGKFDITILPVKELWDFKSTNPQVPTQASIDAQLPKVDYNNIIIEGNTVKLLNGAQVDFGSIAKGYIADRVKEYFLDQGIEKAIINLGGNVLMVGSKGPELPWTVGIQHPDTGRNQSFATVQIEDYSVVTSGVYERFFEKEGKIYHHILDPYTGYPINNGILSVTILSDLSVTGDALSTSLFALGVEKGMELIENMEGVEAVFILEDYTVVKTSGVESYGFELVAE